MLKIYLFGIASLMISYCTNSFGQNINWSSLTVENKHIANLNINWDYGSTIGVAYNYQLNSKLPTLLNVEYSNPIGSNIFDDFKTKIGIQTKIVEFHHFAFSTKVNGGFRRYEQPIVRLLNFGSDISGAIGYYKPKWFIAMEIGFDKAIVTNFKHSVRYKQTFEQVVDGWYEPATGGNFYYGLQAGISFKHQDIYLKGGKVISQDFKTPPLIPYYFQLGYNYKINKTK